MAMKSDDNNNGDLKTCVVLGGRGLIGRSLVERLLKLGNWIVRVADSTESIELDESSVSDSLLSQAVTSGRASYFHVDVRNRDQIINAVEGSVAVFYTDAVDSCGHDIYFYYAIIVQGVKNVLDACRECKVKKLIYNGPADVVYESSRHIRDGDESLPYVGKFGSVLIDLKAQAEALVLLANDIGGLSTCVIRYSNVFGPGDNFFVPLLVHLAKTGWAKFIIGTAGENTCDFTYVENVAHANICAEEALNSRMVFTSGKVFLITNVEPMEFWEFVSLILDGLGYQRPMIKLPAILVRHIISLLKVMQLKIDFTSIRYIFELSSCTRIFNCSAAQKHIGYSPIVSLEEGIAQTIESFSHLAQDSSLTRYGNLSEESKATKFLGNGKVADILLWRNEMETFICFLLLVAVYYWFFLCGRTFVSSLTRLLLLITTLLSVYCFLPPTLSGITVPRIPLSYFEVSEAVVIESVLFIAYTWNEVCHLIESLAQGEDWSTFLKIVALLYFLKVIIASHSLTLAIGVAIVLAFTVFYIYEQYEYEIDGASKALYSHARERTKLLLRNLPSPLASLLSDRQESLGKQHFTRYQYE